MLFKSHILERIAAGQVTVAFRYWTRPSVTPGSCLRTPAGVLAIGDVTQVTPDQISDADAQCAGFASRDALMATLSDNAGRVLYRIDFHLSGADPRIALRQSVDLSAADAAALTDRLAALDSACATGPWTMTVLRLIAELDGRPAAEIAEVMGVEKPTLKRRIRQLKELGLTISLQKGYRLSPRGAKFWFEASRAVTSPSVSP